MHLTLHPLTVKDQLRVQQSLLATEVGRNTPLAAWAFTPHYMWKDVLKYSWAEVAGWWCLFAEHSERLFMPLPPLGPGGREATSASLKDVLAQVMTFMDTRNQGSQISRIENIPAELKDVIQSWEYSLTPKDSDYLYRTSNLIHLKANAYKSQRAAYNRFARSHRIRIAPYRMLDRDGCLALFHRWANQKEDVAVPQIGPDAEVSRLMLRDTFNAHRVVLQEYRELGLTGRVVWVDGSIKAYAFGFPRSREVFCVLLEVADQSVDGLGQYLFREFCRENHQFLFINTMNDWGIPSIARTKHAYRPTQLVPNYMAQGT